jgi:AmmeMemoRadiSam system protein B
VKLRHIRAAVAAGRFYPRDPEELRALTRALLKEVPLAAGPGPKALIVPHAGYLYSGPIAASAYARLAPDRDIIRRIVLVGPSHFVGFPGLATCSAEAFATPLGLVPVDRTAVDQLASLAEVVQFDQAHAREHSLEAQLPFLQTVLRQFRIVPLVAGAARAEALSLVLEALWGGPETRLVISSDLSHYLESEAARHLDLATAQAIERLDPESIREDQACGRLPVCGLLQAARRRGLRARTIDLRNSADTAGPRGSVVGYGAFAFES